MNSRITSPDSNRYKSPKMVGWKKLQYLENILERHGIKDINELDERLHDCELSFTETKSQEKLIDELASELLEYKDIEEELGIDLITLFKALKNGAWIKGTSYNGQIMNEPIFIERPEISLVNKYLKIDENFNTINREENVWCIYIYYYQLRTRIARLKDYGKTWALTKEELEKQ